MIVVDSGDGGWFLGCTEKITTMKMSYEKPWHLLIDKNMTKTELQKVAGLNWGSMARHNKGKNIGTNILLRICEVLDRDLNNILEVTK